MYNIKYMYFIYTYTCIHTYNTAQQAEAWALDILGWGFTQRSGNVVKDFGPEGKREHLRAFIEQYVSRGRKVILVGASLGGSVAIDLVRVCMLMRMLMRVRVHVRAHVCVCVYACVHALFFVECACVFAAYIAAVCEQAQEEDYSDSDFCVVLGVAGRIYGHG
jgi:hypothetical protein